MRKSENGPTDRVRIFVADMEVLLDVTGYPAGTPWSTVLHKAIGLLPKTKPRGK